MPLRAPEKASQLKFSRYQKFVVALLAFLQFSIVLDFMIISPLGAIIMPDLSLLSLGLMYFIQRAVAEASWR